MGLGHSGGGSQRCVRTDSPRAQAADRAADPAQKRPLDKASQKPHLSEKAAHFPEAKSLEV